MTAFNFFSLESKFWSHHWMKIEDFLVVIAALLIYLLIGFSWMKIDALFHVDSLIRSETENIFSVISLTITNVINSILHLHKWNLIFSLSVTHKYSKNKYYRSLLEWSCQFKTHISTLFIWINPSRPITNHPSLSISLSTSWYNKCRSDIYRK